MPKKTYKTKHLEEIQTYLKSMNGTHVTAQDVSRHFASAGICVGTATIYRNLERLVEQGLVAKYTVDGTSSACFEYIGEEEHRHGDHPCYHCKCEDCGKIIHLECDEVKELGRHILNEHGFTIDYTRTVFYGLCADCKKKREEQA